MANPTKGEVSLVLFEDDESLQTRRYTLKFSNSGHREMESYFTQAFGNPTAQADILSMLDQGSVGPTVLTGLFFGATRKFHRRQFPSIAEVDDLMDEIEEEAEDFGKESRALSIALVAAFTKSNPSDIEARILGEEPTPNGESANGSSEEVPKDEPKKKTTKKAASGSGSTS
jgi:hypothetical protein